MKKQYTNLLVGAMIVIDYPNRWQGAKDAATRAQLRADVEHAKNHPDGSGGTPYYFGEKGVVVNYNPNDEKGCCFDVLLDSTGQVVSVAQCEFTVTAMPKSLDQEIVAAVDSLTTAIIGGNKLVLNLLKQLVKQIEDIRVKPL